MSENQIKKPRPPANALHVNAWRDLPPDRNPARFRVTNAIGRCHEIKLKQGNRVVLEALMMQPLYCASPVRISDRVSILKHKFSIAVDTKDYEIDTMIGGRFGIYFLDCQTERLEGGAA